MGEDRRGRKKAEKGKNIEGINPGESLEGICAQQEEVTGSNPMAKKGGFLFGGLNPSIGKDMGCYGDNSKNIEKAKKHATRGNSKIPCVYQKVGNQLTEPIVGQAGLKVAEIAALLAQHQKAHVEEPPSKKRNRGSLGEGGVMGGKLLEDDKKSRRKRRTRRMVRILWIWQRLLDSSANHYESSKLELPEAWEPLDGSGPLPNGEGKETQTGFLNGNQVILASNGILFVYIRGIKNVFVVESVGRSGGLALLWSTNINYSRRHINARVQTEANGNKY